MVDNGISVQRVLERNSDVVEFVGVPNGSMGHAEE